MSLYDDATFIYSGEAAAGAPHRAYVMKPVEKLKTTILNANSDLSTSGTLTDAIGDRGFTIDDSSTNSSASIANGLLTITTGADGDDTKARVYTSDGSSTAYLESGKSYNLTYTVVENNGVTDFSYAEDGIIRPASTEIGTHAVSFKRGEHNDNQYFYLQSETPSANIVLKDIIVREAEQRSLDFRVTRDSNLTATRVKADGLIEKGRENLFLQSNNFDTTWSLGGSPTLTSGHAGYDGSKNAWKLVTASGENIYQNLAPSGVNTFSFYVKGDGSTGVRMFMDGPGNAADCFFNLATGAVTSTSSALIDETIEAITGEAGDTDRWYRISITFLDDDTGSGDNQNVTRLRLYTTENGSTNGAGTLFIQNAQLEKGLVATPYIESKSMTGKAGVLANEPRYDYLTSTTDCPGALMEPGRTNMVQYSEYFGDYTETNTTISDTLETSPEGVKNAYKVLETSATNVTHKFVTTGSHGLESYTNGNSYSVSVFAKAAGRTKFRLKAGTTATAPYAADFTLSGDGTAAAATGNDSNANVSIENYGNGWYRCKIENFTATDTASTRRNIFLLNDSGQDQYDGDTSKGMIFYGYQVEEGPFVTSYIPTYGSTESRTKDKFISPVDDSEYATDDFTFFIDYKDFKSHGLSSSGLWRALYRDSTRSIFQYNKSIGYHGFPSLTPSTPGSEYSSNHATEGANKIAVVYNRDSVAVYVDGTQTKLDYSVDTTKKGLQYIELNYGDSKMTVNSVMVFNRPLTKDEAIALTT